MSSTTPTSNGGGGGVLPTLKKALNWLFTYEDGAENGRERKDEPSTTQPNSNHWSVSVSPFFFFFSFSSSFLPFSHPPLAPLFAAS